LVDQIIQEIIGW